MYFLDVRLAIENSYELLAVRKYWYARVPADMGCKNGARIILLVNRPVIDIWFKWYKLDWNGCSPRWKKVREMKVGLFSSSFWFRRHKSFWTWGVHKKETKYFLYCEWYNFNNSFVSRCNSPMFLKASLLAGQLRSWVAEEPNTIWRVV